MSEGKGVVNWKERMAARVQEVKEDETPAVVSLKLASGIMSIMDQPVPNNQFEGVILKVGTERSYYARDYDPDDRSPPDCYSQILGNDDTFNPTTVPASNVPEPISDTCAECPMSKMGSASRGKGPACKTRRRLVVAPASVVDNPDSLGKQLLLVNVPPTSGKAFSQYVNKLAANGVPPEAAITKLKYGPDKKVMFSMSFDHVDNITDDAALMAIFSRADEFSGLITSGYNYEEEEEAPAPTGKGSKKY